MGGRGSGHYWRFDAKDTIDDFRQLDVRRWQRDGCLAPGQNFGWRWSRDGETTASIRVTTEPGRVILDYRHRRAGTDWQHERYPVLLEWTPCHFGGERAWFLCPAVGCGRRVAILYGGTIFACRHCHDLAYPSQREADFDRLARKADRIRERLDWEPGILNGSGWKPKCMHWRTFERLRAEHDRLLEQALRAADRMLDFRPGVMD